MKSLIEKYDVLGPRYTSYPPVPYWNGAPDESKWFEQLTTYDQIDLYIHIPYCKEICYYCGCNREKLQSEGQKESYLDLVIKEWQLYKDRLGEIKVGHLHLGGGTPSILSTNEFDYLLENIVSDGVKGSVEVDPRTIDFDKMGILRNYGFEKLSFGVQDFDPKVQELVGRIQSFKLVASCVEDARKRGFKSINFDLIFGLPGQVASGIDKTFDRVMELMPDTIAYYSFAYVPKFAVNQNKIQESDLPGGNKKRDLYEIGREKLEKNGYIEIGMDHFARKESDLYKAFVAKEVSRSFMGYTVKGSEALIGLGASSISSTKESYIQNSKNIEEYREAIGAGKLPIIKGHCLTDIQMNVSRQIQEVMCLGETVLPNIGQYDFEDLQKDGLVSIKGDLLQVNDHGRAFLRNICMRFDPLQLNKVHTDVKFSRTI